MCCFRWCGRQLCLHNMPISRVNSTPRPTAVYASDPALPRRPQDSLPPCLLGFGRTRLSLASSFQLPYRTPHTALGQDFTPSPTTRRAPAGLGVRARSARREMREWIGPALASPDLVLDAQPPAQPHSGVIVDRPICYVNSANAEVVGPSA